MNKDKYDLWFKGVIVGIPVGAFLVILIIASAGIVIPGVLFAYFGWLAWRAWSGRKK